MNKEFRKEKVEWIARQKVWRNYLSLAVFEPKPLET